MEHADNLDDACGGPVEEYVHRILHGANAGAVSDVRAPQLPVSLCVRQGMFGVRRDRLHRIDEECSVALTSSRPPTLDTRGDDMVEIRLRRSAIAQRRCWRCLERARFGFRASAMT